MRGGLEKATSSVGAIAGIINKCIAIFSDWWARELAVQRVKAHLRTITGDLVKEVLTIKFKNATIYVSDSWKEAPRWVDFLGWLKTDSLSKMVWIENEWDCITGDTPILAKQNNSLPYLITADELMPHNYPYNTPYFPKDITCRGRGAIFTKINWIVKKKTNKPIIEMASASVASFTEDHKISSNSAVKKRRTFKVLQAEPYEYREAKTILAGDYFLTVTDLSKAFTERYLVADGFDYDYGFFLGLIFSDGGIAYEEENYHYDLVIQNENRDLLEKTREMLLNRFPAFNWMIDDFPSNHRATNYGNRNHPLLVLRPKQWERKGHFGERKQFIKTIKDELYRGDKKIIPNSVLNGNKTYVKGFLDGHYAGDKYGSPNKVDITGLAILLRKIGEIPSIYSNKHKENGYYTVASLKHPRMKRIKNNLARGRYVNNGGSPTTVYDINTTSHNFCAGDIVVHNCDNYSIGSKCRAERRIIGNISYGFVWYAKPAHAANVFVGYTDGVLKAIQVEPQSDSIPSYDPDEAYLVVM